MSIMASIAGAAVGGILGGASAKDTNKMQAAEAERNRQWQERMSNTAHQREVADLRAAGLNPILSAGGGSGSSTPSGGQAQFKDPASSAAQLASAATGAAQAATAEKQQEVQALGQISQAELNSAQTKAVEAQANKTNLEALNVAKQGLLTESSTRLNNANAFVAEGRKGFESRLYNVGNTILDSLSLTGTQMFVENTGAMSPNSAQNTKTLTEQGLNWLVNKYEKGSFNRDSKQGDDEWHRRAKMLIDEGMSPSKNADPRIIKAYNKMQLSQKYKGN